MTTDAPLFSVITVTKNNCAGLGATYASLSAQSCNDYEWIVVDGASTDGTLLFLSKDGLLDCCVSTPDDGIYDAMNKGIARAKGRYLIFMNAGDRFSDPDILSTLLKIIAAEDPDFIYGDALESGGLYKKARHNIERGMITHHQAMLYKRGTIGDLRYDMRYKIAADYDFTFRFLKRAKTIHYCPAALCIFEEGGLSQKKRRHGRNEEFLIRNNQDIPPAENIAVYMRQTLAAFIKAFMPALYRKLR